MLISLMFIALFSSPASSPPRAGPPVRVQGFARRSTPHCGGEAPPSRVLNSTPDTEPWLAKAGATNVEGAPFIVIRPAADGRFTVELPTGRWCLVPQARAARPPSRGAPDGGPLHTTLSAEDLDCHDAEWSRCEHLWDVTPTTTELELMRSGRCSWNAPCGPRGPVPP